MNMRDNKAPRFPEFPECPSLILCLGWITDIYGRERQRYSALLLDEETGEECHIPYAQAVAMMKIRPLQFIRRVSICSVQEWVYRMVKPTRQSMLSEMGCILRNP